MRVGSPGCLEVPEFEAYETERPVGRARSASVAGPHVLVGVNVQFDAVLWGEDDELAEVVDVISVVVSPAKARAESDVGLAG